MWRAIIAVPGESGLRLDVAPRHPAVRFRNYFTIKKARVSLYWERGFRVPAKAPAMRYIL